MAHLHPPEPERLGLTLTSDGAQFAVYSANAERIEFCLFDDEDRETRIVLSERTGHVVHGFLEGVTGGARYGLRAYGPYAPHEGHRFNPAKLLVDPYARALDRPFAFHSAMLGENRDGTRNDDDSAAVVPKAVVTPLVLAHDTVRPHIPWGETVLYELHVRGFSKRHPDVAAPLRGTCAALASTAVMDHLHRIGVTTVELLPIAAAIDEPHLARAGLTNYWGYNTVGWFVPDPRLAPGGIAEVREMVAALQRAGIEVILDVVFNHSGEGDVHGPTLSLRGLDNATYYRAPADAPDRYIDDSGCGNTLALDRPPVTQLALDTLCYWTHATGVDGFRFDLATTLGRRDDGFDPHAPLLAAISGDPLLRTLKMIAEPWDVGLGGYQAGAFASHWGEWNDKFRDTTRRWWRGDAGFTGELATRVAGSADVFRRRDRSPSRSVNFVAAHDGFPLADLVAYAEKHNEANGEANHDGTTENFSWNHGVEGPTPDPRVNEERRHDVRALLVTLLTARGTPMLAMGDELGRTQHGNNNAYAQDNSLTWIDWDAADRSLIDFVGALTTLRREHPALRTDRWLTGVTNPATSFPDVLWRRADGEDMTPADWERDLRVLVAVVSDGASFNAADRVAILFNGTTRDAPALLPPARRGFAWHHVIDSAGDPPHFDRVVPTPASIAVSARSVSIVVERPVASSPSFPRAAGVLLHPTSLPGPNGIGDLGPDAHRFAQVLADAQLTLWQMLPLGPTGFGDSPYQCFSAFAGNPLLVHVPGEADDFSPHKVDFERVIAYKHAQLRRATAAMSTDDAYRDFVTSQAWWLEDFALFSALKDAHGGAPWTAWEAAVAQRVPSALETWRKRLSEELEHVRRTQYLFHTQFHALKSVCATHGIRLMGDLPIYVAHDSSDVWANPALFQLDTLGRPRVQAGVPPDYFSATGQLWGNPLYNWDVLRRTGYDWWIRRVRTAFDLFDVVRIDHFRGFEAYWQVPGAETTAMHGTWMRGPGSELFAALTAALGPLAIVAENLGIITPEVEALREAYGYPGMSILQFAFADADERSEYLPHRLSRHTVLYTGTHDNDTTVGWWTAAPDDSAPRAAAVVERERAFVRQYFNTTGDEIHWTFIRAALASVADTVLFPLQDVLGLGAEARMNRPGWPDGNWRFRFTWDQLSPALLARLRAMVLLYER